MSRGRYWLDRLPALLLNALGMAALAVFLLAVGNSVGTVLLILAAWTAVLLLYVAGACRARKRELDRLLALAEQLEERYLLPEVMAPPVRAEDRVYHRLLKLAEKSMLEQVGRVRRRQQAYKEYIEQWIHEVKTPLTAMQLLCENHRTEHTRAMLAELETLSRLTEQALYYARSEHTEKDYSIREIRLDEVVRGAIADNKYLLRQCGAAVTTDGLAVSVFTDDKWVRFLLNQLISNAVKYRTDSLTLQISAARRGDRIVLSVRDDGIGIPQSDLPRIFDKGFTGRNGRAVPGATGMGLYLCRRLCDRLGIGLTAASDGAGTTVALSFQIHDYIARVQG